MILESPPRRTYSAAMRRKVATITLDEILILENGRRGDSASENMVLTSLIWPRPMIDLRTAVKSVRLEDGERIKFSARPFHEKILFKEVVSGPFGITLEVTERKTPGVIAQFISNITAQLAYAVFPLPPSSETFRRIVHTGVTGAARQVQESPKETILRIAFGHAVIDPAISSPARALEIPLLAPDTLLSTGSGQSRRPPLLTKGQPNGQAILTCSIEED